MDISQTMVPAGGGKQQRRLRTNDEKRRIVEEALSGEASVAAVARRHGVNANLVFNWRKLYQQGLLDQCREPASAALVPVTVAPAPKPAREPVPGGGITIEMGGVHVRVEGPVDREALADVLAVIGAR